MPMLQKKEDKIEFDVINYSIERPKKVDLYTMSTLIYMFETRVREVMLMSDELVTFDLELMRIIAQNSICGSEDEHLAGMQSLIS